MEGNDNEFNRRHDLITQARQRLSTARGQIVTAMHELHDAGQEVDVATLKECLEYLDDAAREV